jgi:hypothetical protein
MLPTCAFPSGVHGSRHTPQALTLFPLASKNKLLTLDQAHVVMEMPKHLDQAKRLLSEHREK